LNILPGRQQRLPAGIKFTTTGSLYLLGWGPDQHYRARIYTSPRTPSGRSPCSGRRKCCLRSSVRALFAASWQIGCPPSDGKRGLGSRRGGIRLDWLYYQCLNLIDSQITPHRVPRYLC